MKQREIKTWAQAKRLRLHRTSPCGLYTGCIEPGVNYFVLALEQLGASTEYSCEGHPNSFYVVFESTQQTAERIRSCGFFAVELEGENRWSLRINRDIDDTERQLILQYAAKAWTKRFGPIIYSKEYSHAPLRVVVPG